ncbi:MAG TPA: trehalose-phosphatase, partial [Rhodospirillales bacterium]|nr:trehalose-phosphatase [Rhodospirillales bacterium]
MPLDALLVSPPGGRNRDRRHLAFPPFRCFRILARSAALTNIGEGAKERGSLTPIIPSLAEPLPPMSRPLAPKPRRLRELPHARELLPQLTADCRAGRLALFLDFDGTLTPIAPHPRLARMDEGLRRILAGLADRMPVAVVSGRAAADVRRLVGIGGIFVAGSHGFEITGPGGLHHDEGAPFAAELDAAEAQLEKTLSGFAGVWVERKPYAIAVHFRDAP